ncbi:GNAT family N-acetyltransferase, partial [Candidatus Latescibacterota bacterium]
GTVCTREEMRGQGIGSRLMRYASEWMTHRGLALSCLHTNPRRYAFYERLGYRRAVVEQPRLMVNLSAAQPAGGITMRSARADDAEALGGPYAATYGRATGAWARSPAFWVRRLQGVPKLWSRALRFAVAAGGPPRAYAAYEETEGAGTVHELGCAEGAEAEAVELLMHLLVGWRQAGVLAAELDLSSSHLLRPRVDHLVSDDRTGWDVVFVRAHDEGRLLGQLLPVLRERAAQAGAEMTDRPEGGVVLQGAGESVPLELGLTELAALMYNGRLAPSMAALMPQLRRRGWTSALFPDTGASRCGLDGY